MASQAQAMPVSYGKQLGEQILAGFRGTIPPVRSPWLYQLNLVLVTLTMVLLPLVYLALIAGVAWGAFWYATHAWSLFLGGLGGIKIRVALYVTPLLLAGVLLVFMVKPLFARSSRESKPMKLDRHQEPVLFAFVERLCQVVGSPVPREIHVDCQVNASASFRRGWLSFFGADLVLTIGLPLTAGMSLRQLAGILAHELGHFSQAAGMRLTYVVRTINFWFYRVVNERDSFDEKLEEAARDEDGRMAVLGQLARFFVWLSRRVLWGLMMVGNAVSSSMMRQMEYDADRYEARLVGPKVFESTVRDLISLGAAYQRSLSDLSGLWQERRLADSLPHLVAANHQRYAGQISGQIDQLISEGKTGLFDTHPADCDRIASAARDAGKHGDGIFFSDLPATALFRDFAALEKAASFSFYREILGDDLQPQDLVPATEALERTEKADADRDALGRYFPGTFSLLRPLVLLPERLLADPGLTQDGLRQARRDVEAKTAEHALELTRYHHAEELLLNSLRAQALHGAGVAFKPRDFDLPRADEAVLAQARSRAETRQSSLDLKLLEHERVDVRRLVSGLGLAHQEDAQELARLLACASHVGDLLPRVHELRRLHGVIGTLWSKLSDSPQNQQNPSLIHAIEWRMTELHTLLEGIWNGMRNEPYPFDHARGETTLAEVVLPHLPEAQNLPALYQGSGQVVEALLDLYLRVLGRLARIAEQVEEGLGMEPVAAAKAG